MIIHTVRPGDSVYSISKRYNVPVQKLIEDNSLENTQRLMIGQAILVMADNVRHMVARGESLYAIAHKYNTTENNILNANPSIADPSKIQAGQIIIIPLSTQNLGTIYVNGYAFPNIDSDTLELTLPHLTYLSIFSYQVNADGSLNDIPDEAIIEAARAKNVAPLMVITNIKEEGGFDSDIAHTILNDENVQKTLIDNVLKTLPKGYHGLDVDFEYIYPEDREKYNQFIKKVVDTLHPQGYTVSTALAPKTSRDQKGLLYEAHDYPFHGTELDHIILMTYEWGYTRGPAQAVSPINRVEKVLDYATSVIPSQKIFMGIPNYGYDWTLPFVQGSSARSLSNTQAINLASKVGASINFDLLSQSPYFYYYDKDRKKHVVWFEDARSIESKLKLVNTYNLGGVSYWTINKFFPQNWLVLESMYTVKKVL